MFQTQERFQTFEDSFPSTPASTLRRLTSAAGFISESAPAHLIKSLPPPLLVPLSHVTGLRRACHVLGTVLGATIADKYLLLSFTG